MWDKSIPKRAFKLSMFVSACIILIGLITVLIGPVVGSPLEVAIRGITGLVVMVIGFWLFFLVYLFFQPNFDGYLDKYGGDDYGS